MRMNSTISNSSYKEEAEGYLINDNTVQGLRPFVVDIEDGGMSRSRIWNRQGNGVSPELLEEMFGGHPADITVKLIFNFKNGIFILSH